ncbi:MAG: hypothetical protein H0W62_14285 [Chitinophagales bacterium]|nr:hypothetical protein [Chitinophagales bacterium]
MYLTEMQISLHSEKNISLEFILFKQFLLSTTDGYIFTGATQSTDGDITGNKGGQDVWVVKVNFNGNIEWLKCYGGTYNEVAYAIHAAIKNGYFISGITTSLDGDVTDHHNSENNEADEWVIRIDTSGNLLWENALGGANYDIAYDAEATSDGGCIVSGVSSSLSGDIRFNKGGEDALLIKLDSAGMYNGVKTWEDLKMM